MNPAKRIWALSYVMVYTFWCLLKVYFYDLLKNPEKIVLVRKTWGEKVIRAIGGRIKIIGTAPKSKDEALLFLGNHMSFLDVPLLATSCDGVFLSKEEVKNWPLFGRGASAVGTLFVKRGSAKSRGETLLRIGQEIKKNSKSVILFPEGTSTVEGTDWKWGTFKLAQKKKIRVQPFRLYYNPPRTCSFIDDDELLDQLWKIVSLKNGFDAEVEFLDIAEVEDAVTDCKKAEELVQSSWKNAHEQYQP